jgi:hypothetical protein
MSQQETLMTSKPDVLVGDLLATLPRKPLEGLVVESVREVISAPVQSAPEPPRYAIEIVNLLNAMVACGLTRNDLIVLLSDKVRLHHRGKPPYSEKRKREIIGEVLWAAEQMAKRIK